MKNCLSDQRNVNTEKRYQTKTIRQQPTFSQTPNFFLELCLLYFFIFVRNLQCISSPIEPFLHLFNTTNSIITTDCGFFTTLHWYYGLKQARSRLFGHLRPQAWLLLKNVALHFPSIIFRLLAASISLWISEIRSSLVQILISFWNLSYSMFRCSSLCLSYELQFPASRRKMVSTLFMIPALVMINHFRSRSLRYMKFMCL